MDIDTLLYLILMNNLDFIHFESGCSNRIRSAINNVDIVHKMMLQDVQIHILYRSRLEYQELNEVCVVLLNPQYFKEFLWRHFLKLRLRW